MSPQSSVRAQRPLVNRPRVSPTSRLISSGGPYLVEFDVDLQRLPEAFVVDQRSHVVREEGALGRALRLQEVAGDRGDEPVALRVALLGDARAVIGLAVAVEVLAVEVLGNREIVVPGLGRLHPGLLQEVGPVVGHLEVAIERDGVDVTLVAGAEVTEERGDVVPLQVLVGLDPLGQRLEVAGLDEVAHPLRGEHGRVVAVGTRGEIGQQLVVEVRERDRDHLHLGARELLEVGCPALQGLRDLRAGEGDDVDRHPLVGLVRGARPARARSDCQGGGPGQRDCPGCMLHVLAPLFPIGSSGTRRPW